MVYNPSHRLFTADYESGDFSDWPVVQNIFHNDPGDTYDPTSHYSAAIVTAPVRQLRYAARFELRDGDVPFSTTERTEVQGPLYTSGGQEGDEKWYQWSVRFDTQFPDDHASTGFGVVAQWHDESGGSPPLGFYVDTAPGEWGLRIQQQSSPGVFIDSIAAWSIPLAKNTWHDIKIRIKWSVDDSVGFVELWHNGEAQEFTDGPGVGTTRNTIRTLVPGGGGTYFKQGYFRHADFTETGIVYHDGYVVASSEEGLGEPGGQGWRLIQPYTDHRHIYDGLRFIHREAKTVYGTDAGLVAKHCPTTTELLDADHVFFGGHEYTTTDTDLVDLWVSSGFDVEVI